MILTREELQTLKEKIKASKGDRCYLHPKYHNTTLTGTQQKQNKKREFDLEHINDDRNDFRIENLELACHSCNIRKMHEHQKKLYEQSRTQEGKVLYMGEGERGRNIVRVDNSIIDSESLSRMSPEMRKSDTLFDVFQNYVIRRVGKEGESEYEDLKYSACYATGPKKPIKPKTGGEWFKMLVSSDGPVKIIVKEDGTKWVVLRKDEKEGIGKVRA
jgi:hypothetical protein